MTSAGAKTSPGAAVAEPRKHRAFGAVLGTLTLGAFVATAGLLRGADLGVPTHTQDVDVDGECWGLAVRHAAEVCALPTHAASARPTEGPKGQPSEFSHRVEGGGLAQTGPVTAGAEGCGLWGCTVLGLPYTPACCSSPPRALG